VFIFVTVFLDMVALGMMAPVLPKFVEGLVGGDNRSAAIWFGYMGMTWAAMQFVFSPIQGALSDWLGRKPVVVMSNFGMALSYLLTAVASSIPALFAARAISGISAASVSTAYAYIADTYEPDQRPRYFGLLGASFGLGFIIGPWIGGQLAAIDPHAPFYVCAALCAVNGLYGLFVLPESLPKERRSPFTLAKANPFAAFGYLRERPRISGLVGSTTMAYFAQAVLPSSMVLYGSYRFGWNEAQAGNMLAAVGLAAVVVQALIVPRVTPILGQKRAIAVGLGCGMAGFCIYAFAPVPWMFYFGIPVVAMWGLAGPSIQTLLTRRVSPNEQGRLQGTVASLQAAAGIFAPGVYTRLLATFLAPGVLYFPGMPFLFAALCLGLAFWLAMRATARPDSAESAA